MTSKKNSQSFSFKITPLLLIVFLSNCSIVGQWWYDRLDVYLANYFFEYAEFSNQQKSYIRKITKNYHEWNKSVELHKYRSLLIEIRELREETTTQDIQKIFQKGEILFKASNDFFTPYLVEFCKTLSNEQVQEIKLHLQKRVEKWELSIEESKDFDKEERTVESFKRTARYLGVKLNRSQINEVKKMSKNIEDRSLVSLQKQKKWNEKFILILEARKKEGFIIELQAHLASLVVTEKRRGEENVYLRIIAKTISSLEENQIKKYKKRVSYFISSIEKILK